MTTLLVTDLQMTSADFTFGVEVFLRLLLVFSHSDSHYYTEHYQVLEPELDVTRLSTGNTFTLTENDTTDGGVLLMRFIIGMTKKVT